MIPCLGSTVCDTNIYKQVNAIQRYCYKEVNERPYDNYDTNLDLVGVLVLTSTC